MTSVPTTKPPGQGWANWADHVYGGAAPYDYAEVETWREGWQETSLLNPDDANPLMNVHGLMWRPAGPKLTDDAKFKRAIERVVRYARYR